MQRGKSHAAFFGRKFRTAILSCLIGGMLFDTFSVRKTLLIAVGICCVGTTLTLLTVEHKKGAYRI